MVSSGSRGSSSAPLVRCVPKVHCRYLTCVPSDRNTRPCRITSTLLWLWRSSAGMGIGTMARFPPEFFHRSMVPTDIFWRRFSLRGSRKRMSRKGSCSRSGRTGGWPSPVQVSACMRSSSSSTCSTADGSLAFPMATSVGDCLAPPVGSGMYITRNLSPTPKPGGTRPATRCPVLGTRA